MPRAAQRSTAAAPSHPLLDRLVTSRDRIAADLETLEYIEGLIDDLEHELLDCEAEHRENLLLWDAANETSQALQARVASTTTLRLDCEAARDAHALEGDAIDVALTKAAEQGVYTAALRQRVDVHVATGKRLCENMREYGQLATALATELHANAAAYGECGVRATAWAEKVGFAQGRRSRAIVARDVLVEALDTEQERYTDAILLAVLHRSCTPHLDSAAVPVRRSKRANRTGPYATARDARTAR